MREDGGMEETEGARPNDFLTWADWMGQLVELGQRGAELVGQIQADWEQLSRQDATWTTDTIMNEVVNSWERWTPFVGEVVQHGVQGSSRFIREYWPDAPADMDAWRSIIADSAIGDLSAKYVEVTTDMTERMAEGQYDSADAVDTFAKMGGMFAQDTWANMARARAESGSGSPADTDTTNPPAGADD